MNTSVTSSLYHLPGSTFFGTFHCKYALKTLLTPLENTFGPHPFCADFIANMHWKRQSPHTGPSILLAKCRIMLGSPLQDLTRRRIATHFHQISCVKIITMLQKPSQMQRGRTRTNPIMRAKRVANQQTSISKKNNCTDRKKKYIFEVFSNQMLKGKRPASKTRKITPHQLQNRIWSFYTQML